MQKPRVLVKYEIFKSHLSNIRTLSVNNGMVVFGSGSENEPVKVMRFQTQDASITYKEVLLHKVTSVGPNFIQWSPNGQYLALASEKVTIWKHEQGNFSRFRQYKDELFEVTAFAWSPNSNKYAVSGINQDLSIYIRSLEEQGRIKELKNQCKVLGLVWDPYDKHLGSLLASNQVVIYKCTSWEISHKINLSLDPTRPLQQTTKREDRKIDWSPDFRYLMITALSDRKVPLVVALDRNRNFQIRAIFMGPFSSINCVKFNPCLFNNNGDIINVFAMGDNDGNISVWTISEKFCTKKPLMLFKSHKQENELIEKIEWSQDGRTLFASTHKRYMFTAIVDEDNFGRKLTQKEQQSYIQNIYGSVRSIASMSNQFRIFKFSDPKPMQIEISKPKQEQNKILEAEPQELVFTEQKVITTGGKKKIVPSVLVKKKDIEKNGNIEHKQVEQSQQSQTVNNPQPAQPMEVEPPKIELLQCLESTHKMLKIDDFRHVSVEEFNSDSMVRIVWQRDNIKQLISKISISGSILYIHFEQETLIIYTNKGYLYSFNKDGQAVQLPIHIGKIHLFQINSHFDILSLSTSCQLRLFNIHTRQLYTNCNISQLLEHSESPIESILLDEDKTIIINLSDKTSLVWDQQLKVWCQITSDLDLGRSTIGKAQGKKYNRWSLRQESQNRQFMEKLLRPPALAHLQQLQYNIIFYKKHKSDRQKYNMAMIQYVNELARQKQHIQLRRTLKNIITENVDHDLVREIMKIRSPVMEEFMMMYRI